MIVLPPDNAGAHKLRTIPPTWKSGIMFTIKVVNRDPNTSALGAELTVDVVWTKVP